ncbi:Inhibitor of nuclear factor kappa-B kinase subunit beta [Daphnia magna]|uniref:IkappaB kinase n=1 Tax=Daphnia magna TaxID=35525 RepID=A0A0P5B9C1_9CRUS|nr:Inhibitor of nuclear factor kappa-B kinase subunit beta [Daphnia magna]
MDQLDSKMEKLEFGEWRIDRLLGSGAFGKVLLLSNKQTGEKIAVKKAHRDSVFSINNNWDKELEILLHLKHPGIVASLPVPLGLEALSHDAPILCMEYCNGGDLRQVLNKPINCCGIPEKDVLHILRDISSAVTYLHSVKVVHRDIKPENVVIQQTDEKNKYYKLIDLGMAKNLNKQSLCHTLVGTLQYLAPELFSCEKYNNTVDFWSLGIVIHECITGVRPFLPGQPPVDWMQHVERKTYNDICIYAHPDGEIIFSQKLFNENHLSSAMQILMEDWLKYMLDWNPAMRGRHQESDASHPPGPIVAFQILENILKTEVVSIFWVEGLALLSYAVTDDVTMETIHEWIERDTGINQRYQLLVLPRGGGPASGKSARQLLSFEEHGNVCLFSKVNNQSECKLTQVYPEFLEIMLANPRKEYEYRIQKRMWAQSVFFINHQTTLYRKLIHALKIHSTYMTVRASLLKQQIDYINGALRHAVSCHDVFTSSLKQDQQNYKLQSQRGGLPSCTLLEKWDKEEVTMQTKLAELQSKCSLLEQVVQSTVFSVAETAKLAGAFLAKPSDALDKYSQLAVELYGDLQKRRTEQRQQLENNVAMTKIVVKVLKNRNQLFSDCFTQIRVVEKTSGDVDSFLPQLLMLKNEIDHFQDQIFALQTSRQNDVWTLLERAVTLWQRTSVINQPHAASEPNLLTIPSLSQREDDARESMVVIHENQSLRYQIQDTLSRGLSATCNLTPHKIDWDFLNN